MTTTSIIIGLARLALLPVIGLLVGLVVGRWVVGCEGGDESS